MRLFGTVLETCIGFSFDLIEMIFEWHVKSDI
jgi:hypothetical protein